MCGEKRENAYMNVSASFIVNATGVKLVLKILGGGHDDDD